MRRGTAALTAPVPLRCPGGALPERLSFNVVVAIGHGALFSIVNISPRALDISSFSGDSSKPLTDTDRQSLMSRLEQPTATAPAGRWDTAVNVEMKCDGRVLTESHTWSAGRQHPTFDSVLKRPSWATVSQFLGGTLADLDPRPRRAMALATELLRLDHPTLWRD